MYCKHCGKQIADDSLFCEFCGTKQDHAAPTEEPAPAAPEAPAAAPAAAGMAFSSDDGFTSAPAGGNGFMPGAPAPGVPPVQDFAAAPAAEEPVAEAAEAVEEAVEEPVAEAAEVVEEAVEEPAAEVAEAVEEPVAEVEEAVSEVAEAVEEAVEEPVAEVAEAVEEAVEEPVAEVAETVEEAVEEPAADDGFTAAPAADAGFTQAAPQMDGFTQAAPQSAGFTQTAPQNDGFTQTAPGAAAGMAGAAAYGAAQQQGMPLDYNQQNGQWSTGASQNGPVNTMPQGDYMGNAVPQKKGGKKKVIIPIAIIVGLLVIGGIIMAVTGGFGGGSSNNGGGHSGNASEYKENCMLVPYDDLFDNLDSYAGEDVEFTGEVFEMHDDGLFVMDTDYDEEYDMYYGGTLIIRYDGDDVENWDEITVYGTVESDLAEFESEYGDYSVPVIDAQYIDHVE